MPPKDNFKYLTKMNKTELKRVAKHESVDISGIDAKAPILSAIKKKNPAFPKSFDLLNMKWSSDPADATEPSTAAQPTEEVEDPRNDTATEIQKVVRGIQGRQKAANLNQEAKNAREAREAKEAKTDAATELQKIVRGKQGRKIAANLKQEAANLKHETMIDEAFNHNPIVYKTEKLLETTKKLQKNVRRKQTLKIESQKREEEKRQEVYERRHQEYQDSATSIQKVVRSRQGRKIAGAAALSAETATRLIASKKEQKDKDEGPPEGGQFKKITRKNVGDIDDNVKVHIKSNVSPTVTASAIAKQMQIINKRRFTIGHANIIYHRLGGIAKKATDFL